MNHTNQNNGASKRAAFCVYITSVGEGRVPSVRGEGSFPYVFDTELEAQREIADNAIERLQEFMDGERDFEDAITVEEYVTSVDVYPDGSIVDEFGRRFGKGDL